MIFLYFAIFQFGNAPKITCFVANIMFLMCIPLRFAQLLDTEETLITDEEADFSGCWKTYAVPDDGEDDGHGDDGHMSQLSTLMPQMSTVFKLAKLTTARSGGGKAKLGGNKGGGDDDEDDGPEAVLPCNYRQWEELLLIWAIPMIWFYLIFFAA